MDKQIFKVGVLGCANIAIRSLLPTFSANRRFQVAAIASRDLEKAQRIASLYGCKAYGCYEELIDDSDIDLVYMPLPTGLHYEWGKKILQSGKHLLSEKSLACSYSEVYELVQLARQKRLLLMENFQFRFHSQTTWIRNLIASGELGDVRCFRSSFGFPPFKDITNIRYNKSLGGGALLDAGAYTVKSMNVFLPQETFILKSATLVTPESADVDIYGGAYFESVSGVIAELAFGFDNYYQCGFEVWGSRGKLTSTRAYTAPSTLSPTVLVETENKGKVEHQLEPCDHFMRMSDYVASLLDASSFEEEYRQNLIQAEHLQNINNMVYGK